MSLCSYISFPRKANLRALKKEFDRSKCLSFAEIKGTALESEIPFDICGLPGDLHYYFGDRCDLYGLEITEAIKIEYPLRNRFVYSLVGELEFSQQRIKAPIFLEYDGGEEFIDKLNYEIDENVEVCRSQLYNLVKDNILPGEFIEIYSWYYGDGYDCLLKEIAEVSIDEIFGTDKLKLEHGTAIAIYC